MLLSSKCRKILGAALFLLAMFFVCQMNVHAAGWNGGQRSIWELISQGSEGNLRDGQRISLARGDDKIYTITDRSLLAAPEALTVFSVSNQNPKNLVIRIYNSKGQALGLSFNEENKNCATAALYHGVTYYIRFTATGTLSEKVYTVEAETLKETRGKLQETLAPGERLHVYHHLNNPVWKGLKLHPIGENNVSLDVNVFDSGYKLHLDKIGTDERVFYAGGAFYFFTVTNTGEEDAVVNLRLGAPDDPVFEEEDPKTESEDPKTESEDPKTESEDPKTESEDPKTESEDPKTESEDPKTESEESKTDPWKDPETKDSQTTEVPIRTDGYYAFTVYNCRGQKVDAKVTSEEKVICSGSNYENEHSTNPAEAFSMGGYFTAGSYTLSVSSLDVYVVTMPTDRYAGSCGKNVWWNLIKTNTSEGSGGRSVVKEEEYILEINGFGPTYDYGYDSAIGFARLPWTDAVDSYSKETSSGVQMMIRRIVEVRVGAGVTRIGEWLLSGLDEIGVPISLPDSLKEIGSFAFYGTNIEEQLTIPDGVKRIDAGGLKEANAEVVMIGKNAKLSMEATPGFLAAEVGGRDTVSIALSGSNPYLKAEDGVLYTKEMDRLIAFPAGTLEKEYEVAEGTKTIGSLAFCGCKLENLVLPESVETLEKDAFVGCSFRNMHVRSSLLSADEPISGDESNLKSNYEGIYFYRDAPKGQMIGQNTSAVIYIPQGNSTWSEKLQASWKDGKEGRTVTFYLWSPETEAVNG